jgi:ABC-type phosphate/phosphonate transport system substrate-binding protein
MALALSFGIVAPEASDVLARLADLAAFLRDRDLLDLGPSSFPTYKELAASVREGSSDVAWLAPVSYAWLAEAVTPIGSLRRAGETEYSTALVVREDSSLESLDDLRRTKGLRAGWVDPWSAAGYVVPRLELARSGILAMDVFAKETFHGTHALALEALAEGEADVVATYALAKRDGLATRTIATWGPIPNDVIAVRRNLGPSEFTAIRDALRAVTADEAGRVRMRALFGGDELTEGVGEGHVRLRLAYESGIASGLFD